MHISDGLRAYGIKRKAVIILVILPFLLISLNCIEGSPQSTLASPSHVSLGDSILIAGMFHYFDVTLPEDHTKLCIIAYNGDTEPSLQERSEKNYYQWEYDNGNWSDASGYDSTYLDPSFCSKKNTTYEFYLSISQKANPGSWTIKVLVDDSETSTLSIQVVIGDFCLFFSSIIGVFEPAMKHRTLSTTDELRCSSFQKKLKTSETDIEKKIDRILQRQLCESPQKDAILLKQNSFNPMDESEQTQESIRSTISQHPRTTLRELNHEPMKNVFIKKKGMGGTGLWAKDFEGLKRFFIIIIIMILLCSASIIPMVALMRNINLPFSNAIMNNRGFDIEGIVEFKEVCSTQGQENTTVVSECIISVNEPCVFEPVLQIEIGKPVEWKQSFDVENNFTVNISGSAYNISVNDVVSENDVIIVENVRKSLQEYNLEKGKDALAKEIKALLQSIKSGSNEASSQQELYQLYGMFKDNVSFAEILLETYDDIEHYIDQFILEDAEAQLILSNISGEVEVTYFTEAPKVLENIIDDSRKQIMVYSDMHYENVLTYTSIVESPQNTVKLYSIVNGSYVLMRNATYVDTNGNGFIDKIEWIIADLSNQTFEIVIIKAEYLNEHREFVSDIYDEVYRRDGIWSEPIYHHEYVRVTFESNLTKNNDITLYARNTHGLDTIVEVYYYDSDEKITEFPIIGEEGFYRVYLTAMTGQHRTFDLRIKNLDNNISAYLEFDYIVDPTGWVSPTGHADPSGQWTTETNAYDDNTGTYASHTGSGGWGGFLELSLSSPIYCNRVRVFSDFGYGVVDRVDVDIYNSTSWIDKFNGTISDAAWTQIPFSAETNVTKARFRYHYLVGGWSFWLYEFDFWQGQLLTLPSGTTLNATSIDESTVILNGNVSDDGGEPCEYRFQYGSTTSYGNNTTWGGSETKDSNYGTMIHNLSLFNTYQYRVQVRNSVGTVNGSNKNFTTALPSLGWVTPTSNYDANSQWSDEINAYDDDTDSYTRSVHDVNDPDGQWSFFIYMNHSVLLCDKVRFYAKGLTGDAVTIDSADLDVRRDGVWVDVFQGSFSDKQWVEKNFTKGSVDSARIRFHVNVNNGGLYYELYEFDFNKTSGPVPTITNPGPANGSVGITITPQLNITVNNPDGDSMTLRWFSNSSGSWQLFGTNSTISNGTYHQRNNNFSTNNTKYWWKVVVTDGTDTNTSWYYFATRDTNKPTSSVTTISPYWKTTAPLTITATASDTGWSGLKNVTLYYRYRATNASSWGGNVSFGVDTDPWVSCSWSFTFTNGSGHYQFYSIASDNATNVELAAGSADTQCGYDTLAPSSQVNSISPYNVTVSPFLINATASDDTKNVTLWYKYSTQNSSWWNPCWSYRKRLTINGKNEGYHMKLIVGNTSGGNGTCNGHAQSDFDDIRFISYSDNTTQLSYWLKNFTTNTQATFWLNNSFNDTYIWMYYGNKHASTTSNGDVTFYFFDDFSNGLGKWVMNSWNTDSIFINNTQGNPSPALRHNPDNSIPANRTYQDTRIRTTYKILNGIIEYDVYLAGSARVIHQFGWRVDGLSWTNGYAWRLQNANSDGGFFEFSDPITWAQIGTAFPNVATGTWYHVKINVSGAGYSAKITPSAPSGASARSVTDSTKTTADYLVSHVHGVSMTSANYVLVDNVFVRKYRAVPPTWGSVGSEESGYVVWSNSSNPYNSSPWSWGFNFPESYGYYWFYSIAVDFDGNEEDTPNAADAFCRYTRLAAPIINSYDLRNVTGSKLNNATGLLDVNSEYQFIVNVTVQYGWLYLDSLAIQAWYDHGNESSMYNQTIGGNLNMYLRYENHTGTASFQMLWPDDEAQLVIENCSETIINSTTRVITISFRPFSQTRWAGSNNTWDTTANVTNDPYSWNFNITATDVSGLKAWKRDEYGIYKFAAIQPQQNWVDVSAPPGYLVPTNVVNVTYSSNYDFNISIYFEENLTNVSSGGIITIANNVHIRADADLYDDITADMIFNGIGEANAIEVINTSGGFHNNNISQVVRVQFNVYIPFGTIRGQYTAHVATKIKQKE